MSNESSFANGRENLSRDELMSALFANMVVQQTNMALVFLGKVPHPEKEEPVQDLDAAQLFIDQLEMLAVKTRGNLNKDEDRLLQQSLMTLRMSFVEAVEKKPSSSGAKPVSATAVQENANQTGSDASSQASAPAAESLHTGTTPPETGETHKRFTKKY